jgi:hypothetical protein
MIGRIAVPFALLVLASGAPPQSADAGFQILIGPAFEQFVAKTEALCRQARFLFVKPADLDWEEEGFDATLAKPEQRRERRAIPRLADGTPARCAHSPGGLSCPAVAALEGIRRAGLMDRFARFACANAPPPHRGDPK